LVGQVPYMPITFLHPFGPCYTVSRLNYELRAMKYKEPRRLQLSSSGGQRR